MQRNALHFGQRIFKCARGRFFGLMIQFFFQGVDLLVDQNPYGFQDSFGILNLSAGVQDKGGHWSVTAFVNNVFNKVYYTDIEDFWSSPWGGTDTVVGQPARDAHVYGGLRANYKF